MYICTVCMYMYVCTCSCTYMCVHIYHVCMHIYHMYVCMYVPLGLVQVQKKLT